MNRNTHQMLSRLERIGFSCDEAIQLRRIAMTLHRWHELECGDGNDYASWGIERDETTGKPYMVIHPHAGKTRRYPIADRERGALRRLDAIIARYPGLAYYVQADPRGAPLYIYHPAALMGRDIESCYSSIGDAIYK